MAISQIVLFIIFQALPLAVSAKNTRFQQWFPTYRHDFENILSRNCSKQYQSYLNGTGYLNKACPVVVDCILSNTRESYKTNMASASVLLGLTPTILTMLGCGPADIAFLSTRRPFLSLCLAIGSPTVSPVRTFEYDYLFKILQMKLGRNQHSRRSLTRKALIVVAEYLLALAATVNVATISYDLGVR